MPHETEIYHIKEVTPDQPQYIGSNLHFSCGKEVRSFQISASQVNIYLDTTYYRVGQVFVFIPRTSTSHLRVSVNGEPSRCDAVGNTPKVSDNGSPRLVGRVVAIPVTVYADGRDNDGAIQIDF